MKKMKRFASAALAALLLAGSAPSALALDTTPPMYKQFGYDSAEDFTRSYLGNFVHFDYDTASDMSAGMYSSCTRSIARIFLFRSGRYGHAVPLYRLRPVERYGRLLSSRPQEK